MSDKVKLPREIAEAMRRFQQQYGSEKLFQIEEYVGEDMAVADAYDVVCWMRKGNRQIYYTALVNGYEVEEDPEVITITASRKKLVRNRFDRLSSNNFLQEADVIAKTLSDLGITIKGVNA